MNKPTTHRTKWMTIAQVPDPKKTTKLFNVISNEGNHLLGHIKWYGPWRQYTFMSQANTVFEKQCLKDIADFLIKLMDERKKAKTTK